MVDNVTNKLGTVAGDKPTYRIFTRVKSNTELPYRIAISYYDIDLGGAPAVVYSETVRKGGRDVRVTFPVFMRRSEAKQTADRLMLKAWAERIEYKISLPIEYVRHDPGDVIELFDEETNKTILMRITEMNLDPRGFVEISGVRHDPRAFSYISTYTDNTAVNPTSPIYDGSNYRVFESHMASYDMPQPPSFYIAVMQTENWRGGTVFCSKDLGGTWQNLGDHTASTFIGTVKNTLGPGSWAIRSLTKKLIVEPHPNCTYQLTSKPLSQVLENQNLLYINGELIRFEEATLLPSGEYELSGLHRGVRGTEHLAGNTISAGAEAILMDGAIPINFGDPGDIVEVRIPVIQNGEDVTTVSGQQLVLEGLAHKALTPVRQNVKWLSSTTARLYFAHRNRYSRDWQGYAEISRDPDWDRFWAQANGGNKVPDSDYSIPFTLGDTLPTGSSWTIEHWQANRKNENGYRFIFTLYANRNYKRVQ